MYIRSINVTGHSVFAIITQEIDNDIPTTLTKLVITWTKVPQVPHPNNRTPAFVWGEGHPIRFAMADQLTQGEFATQTIVLIDSCFTQVVYGQHADKQDERRIHLMQTLHVNNKKLADDANLIVMQSYELAKVELKNIYTEPQEAFGEARTLAEACIVYFPKVVQTGIGVEALAW